MREGERSQEGPLKVLQLSLTEAAGMPYRLWTALSCIETECRYVSYVHEMFPADITAPSAAQLRELVHWADVIHCHNALVVHHFERLLQGKCVLLHLHGTPDRNSGYCPNLPHVIATPDLFSCYPNAAFMPNLVLPLDLPRSALSTGDCLRIFKSPSIHDKHHELLHQLARPILDRFAPRVEIVSPSTPLTYAEISELRATCHISFDHMHGYYGLESLESLAQGLVAINGASPAVLASLEDVVGVPAPFALARSPHELGTLLVQLVREAFMEPAVFEGRRSQGPRFITESYSPSGWAQRWLELYGTVLRGERPVKEDEPGSHAHRNAYPPTCRPLTAQVNAPQPDYQGNQIAAHVSTHSHEADPGRGAFLKALIDIFPRPVDHLLEVGCHNGMETEQLRQVARRITGVELGQPYLVDAARRGLTDFTPLRMDMHSLAFGDESFDGVFANNVLEHAHDPFTVVRELYRVLRPGGLIVAAVPPDALGARILPYHLWRAMPEEIERVFFMFNHKAWLWDVSRFGIASPASAQKMVIVVGEAPRFPRVQPQE